MKFRYSNQAFPAIPIVDIRLGVPRAALSVGPLRAYVDTGADATIVPAHHLRSLEMSISTKKHLRSPWGERRRVAIYRLDVGIGNMRLPSIEIVR